MHFINPNKKIIVQQTSKSLYKWSRMFNHLQRNHFVDTVELRRERQVKDFITLNGYKNVHFKIDTDLFSDLPKVDSGAVADLVVITDQKFSRYPCPVIIEKIQQQLLQCPALYLCLNRHYINIDNSYLDQNLDDKFTIAVTQWLKKNLPDLDIVDLSLDYIDCGRHFTWAIPDRHYFIRKNK